MPAVPPTAIGEIAIRTGDVAGMLAFYRDVIGLEVLREGEDISFLKVSDGVGGHTNVIALFSHRIVAAGGVSASEAAPVAGPESTLHHIALSMPLADQTRAIAWYEEIEQPFRIEHFPWIGWRGVFTTDPDGNTVELVAYDESLLES
jgi:catechol 2,3-dioxygenase-like lactoylglutathione lyase family enzyme